MSKKQVSVNSHSLSGKELYAFLNEKIEENVYVLETLLAQYDNIECTKVWSDFIWYLEEFINVFFELRPSEKQIVLHTSIRVFIERNSVKYRICREILKDNFGPKVADRFEDFISLYRNLLDTDRREISVEDLLNHCMSRRLHYLSILYLLSKYASGDKKIDFNVCELEFRPYVDILTSITGGFNAMIQAMCLPDFKAVFMDGNQLRFNKDYSQLDDCFLEPQRITAVDIIEHSNKIDHTRLLKKSQPSICSIEEYEVMLHNDGIYNKRYELEKDPIYQELRDFFKEMWRFFVDEYHIEVSESDYKSILEKYPNITPYKEPESLFEIQNSRFAFFKISNVYYSTFFLLQRFYQNAMMSLLIKNRRFQIDSGFMFEDNVIDVVTEFGFVYHPECKRIKRKEFDVVCTKGNIIYNFQCKNNYLDVSNIDIQNVKGLISEHKKLSSKYKEALRKEIKREALLKRHFGKLIVKHFVISKYPVVTDNPNVIPFNKLRDVLSTL